MTSRRPEQPRSRISEFDSIERLAKRFARVTSKEVRLGIGDDAALLHAAAARSSMASPWAWTVDDSVEGVHFRLDWMTLRDAAERAFHAAASDLAAMGARPSAALVCLELPPETTPRELDRLAAGLLSASRAIQCPIVGGNLTRGPHFRITTTLLGRARHPVTRALAKPGQALWLVGAVGLAGAGRAFLERAAASEARTPHGRGRRRAASDVAATPPRTKDRALRACVSAFRHPRARIEEGLRLDGRVHACIDISDGLGADAAKLAAGSGVRLSIDLGLLSAALRPELIRAAALLGRDAVELALTGGEDYALLVTGPRERPPAGATRIGEVGRGSGAELRTAERRVRLGEGFDHLAPAR